MQLSEGHEHPLRYTVPGVVLRCSSGAHLVQGTSQQTSIPQGARIVWIGRDDPVWSGRLQRGRAWHCDERASCQQALVRPCQWRANWDEEVQPGSAGAVPNDRARTVAHA